MNKNELIKLREDGAKEKRNSGESTHLREAAKVESDIEQYLANGGKITHVEAGFHADEVKIKPVSKKENRDIQSKRMGRMFRNGATGERDGTKS